MNQNDILTQQQAVLNQLMHNSQQMMWGAIAIQVGLMILGVWVIYMFYARLRDIADELRMFRIAYEFAHSPSKSQSAQRTQSPQAAEQSR